MNSTEKSKIYRKKYVSGCIGNKIGRRTRYLLLAPGWDEREKPPVAFPVPLWQGPVAVHSFHTGGAEGLRWQHKQSVRERSAAGIWVSILHRAMLTEYFWLITQILHNKKIKTFYLPSLLLTPPPPTCQSCKAEKGGSSSRWLGGRGMKGTFRLLFRIPFWVDRKQTLEETLGLVQDTLH